MGFVRRTGWRDRGRGLYERRGRRGRSFYEDYVHLADEVGELREAWLDFASEMHDLLESDGESFWNGEEAIIFDDLLNRHDGYYVLKGRIEELADSILKQGAKDVGSLRKGMTVGDDVESLLKGLKELDRELEKGYENKKLTPGNFSRWSGNVEGWLEDISYVLEGSGFDEGRFVERNERNVLEISLVIRKRLEGMESELDHPGRVDWDDLEDGVSAVGSLGYDLLNDGLDRVRDMDDFGRRRVNVNSMRVAVKEFIDYPDAMKKYIRSMDREALTWNVEGALDAIDSLVRVFEDWKREGII